MFVKTRFAFLIFLDFKGSISYFGDQTVFLQRFKKLFKAGVGYYFTQRARFGKTVEAAGRTLIAKQGEDLLILEIITVHVRM